MHTAQLNLDQIQAWNGAEGDLWVEHEDHYDASMRPHGWVMLRAAGLAQHDRVLDIGCGCGESTRQAAVIVRPGPVLGVDLSARMIERARARSKAEGLTNTRFLHADAQAYPFEEATFDVAISRFGAMFFGDPIAAFRNIRRALRPRGRVAMLAWRELARNEWVYAVRDALAMGRRLPEPQRGAPGGFALADPEDVTAMLVRAGFAEVALAEVAQPVRLGEDADDAFNFVRTIGLCTSLLAGLDVRARDEALDRLRAVVVSHDTGHGVLFDSRAWLITATRVS